LRRCSHQARLLPLSCVPPLSSAQGAHPSRCSATLWSASLNGLPEMDRYPYPAHRLRDVLGYLLGCLLIQEQREKHLISAAGDPHVSEMMQNYQRPRNRSKGHHHCSILDSSPLFLLVDLVTPVPSGVAHPLIEGMKNEVVCRTAALMSFVSIKKTPFKEAVALALSEEKGGPGIAGW